VVVASRLASQDMNVEYLNIESCCCHRVTHPGRSLMRWDDFDDLVGGGVNTARCGMPCSEIEVGAVDEAY